MNNDIAIISDLHFGNKRFSKKALETKLNYFEEIFFPYLLKHKIKYVLNLGDTIHNRNFIDLYILEQLKTRFFQWFEDNGIHQYILVGTHDSYLKNSIKVNFLTNNLKEFSNYIHPITKPTRKQIGRYNICLIPWITDIKELKLPKPSQVDLIGGHFDINNAYLNSKIKSKGANLDYHDFKDYKLVVSGHFHNSSFKDNFAYLGTPYQMDWGDFGSKKGFWILKDNLELVFHENKVSPKYIRMFYTEKKEGEVTLSCLGADDYPSEISVKEASEIAKHNHIKFIVKEYTNQLLLSNYFERITKYSLDRIDIINENSFLQDIDENIEEHIKEEIELSDIMVNYVNMTISKDLNKTKVIEKIENLFSRANEIIY